MDFDHMSTFLNWSKLLWCPVPYGSTDSLQNILLHGALQRKYFYSQEMEAHAHNYSTQRRGLEDYSKSGVNLGN